MANYGQCKACGETQSILNPNSLCYKRCAMYSDDDTARCPRCGYTFSCCMFDYDGELEYDICCPECDHEFAVQIDVEYVFTLYSPDRIIEDTP